MPEGQLLRDLFRGHVRKDEELFRRAAKEIVEQEKLKNHGMLASDLERILVNERQQSKFNERLPGFGDVPKDKDKGFPLLHVRDSDLGWDDLSLPEVSTTLLKALVKENQRRELLAAAGIFPKQRVLFYGPPGCGKTVTATALATDLGWPLAVVRLDTVVSSFLGETSTNLRKIFDFISHRPFVVLFDEFDALGKERESGNEHGELLRVVNALLQLIDAFEGESLLVFATNHQRMLDSALWRRFEVVVCFGIPTTQERTTMLRRFVRNFRHDEAALRKVAMKLSGATGADVEWVALETVRGALLLGHSTLAADDFSRALDAYEHRRAAVENVERTSRRERGSTGGRRAKNA